MCQEACTFSVQSVQEIQSIEGGLTVERMARCQRSHEVCAILKHTLHCWKNPLQDLTALVTIVHPDEVWSLQWHISLVPMAPQAFNVELRCGQHVQEIAGMPHLNILALVPVS